MSCVVSFYLFSLFSVDFLPSLSKLNPNDGFCCLFRPFLSQIYYNKKLLTVKPPHHGFRLLGRSSFGADRPDTRGFLAYASRFLETTHPRLYQVGVSGVGVQPI